MPADIPQSSPPDATAWPVLALTVGAGVAAAFQVGKVPVALPLLRAELGLDLVTAAWVLSTRPGVRTRNCHLRCSFP